MDLLSSKTANLLLAYLKKNFLEESMCYKIYYCISLSYDFRIANLTDVLKERIRGYLLLPATLQTNEKS